MYKFLFKNRWIALAFVVITMVSVKTLVGSEGENGMISRTQGDLLAQREEMRAAMSDLATAPATTQAAPGTSSSMMGFTPDEDLIDDTSGFDPTPAFEGEVQEPQPGE